MSRLVLAGDQSFVGRDELCAELDGLAQQREPTTTGASTATSPLPRAVVKPGEESLVGRLWRRHLGRLPPQAARITTSAEQSAKVLERLRPIIDAIRDAERKRPQPRRFPR